NSTKGDSSGSIVKFALRCGVKHKELWNCDSEVGMSLLKANGKMHTYSEQRMCFDENNNYYGLHPVIWTNITNSQVFS
ncbi:hypothetical protein PMAYCL1PPCAC_25478, partial [Pristionchus mayeri]